MKKIGIVIIIMVVGAAYAVTRPADEPVVAPVGILEELSRVLHKMDTVTVLTIEGTITARDLADSTRNMTTTFCYSRDGNQAYYRVGQQEMISLQDAYIVVAHDVRKVFLASARDIVSPVQLPVAKEVDLLADEGYRVARRVDEKGVHISLLNNLHPTCRAYDVTYDSTGWIRETFMRMADDAVPEDSTRDKFIGISFRSCEPGIARKALLQRERYMDLKGYKFIYER